MTKPLLVWDGEGTGSQASGWASCQKEKDPECVAELEAKPRVGREESVGLEFRAKGREWLGFGWNWFSWWPNTAGTDISKHQSLRFWIKVSGEPGLKPEPFTVQIWLGGSSKGGEDQSAHLPLLDYAQNFANGQWQEVTVPLAPLLRGEGENFDTHKAWAINLGAWNQGTRDYVIHLDDITFL